MISFLKVHFLSVLTYILTYILAKIYKLFIKRVSKCDLVVDKHELEEVFVNDACIIDIINCIDAALMKETLYEKKVKSRYFSKHRNCEKCGQISTMVRFIDPFKPENQELWLKDNCIALCKNCNKLDPQES